MAQDKKNTSNEIYEQVIADIEAKRAKADEVFFRRIRTFTPWSGVTVRKTRGDTRSLDRSPWEQTDTQMGFTKNPLPLANRPRQADNQKS